MQRRSVDVDDVHAHLDASGCGELQADRLHTGHPAARLTNGRGHVPCHRDVVRREVEVVRDEHVTSSDENRARAWVDLARPLVGDELAVVDACAELVEPPTPEVGGSPAPTDLAVQEDRKPELVSDTSSEVTRGRDRSRHLVGAKRHERHDIGGPHAWVHAGVLPEVDALGRYRDAREQRIDERRIVTDQGEHRPVVIDVRVDVEELDALRERIGDRRDDIWPSPFRDVGHGLEHDPYPTKPSGWGDRKDTHQNATGAQCRAARVLPATPADFYRWRSEETAR